MNLAIVFAITITYGSVIFICLPVYLSERRFEFSNNPQNTRTSFFIPVLSLDEIAAMARSKVDRAGFIKDYYDFKHKNIMSLIKGFSAVIVVNLGVLVKNHFEFKTAKVVNPSDDLPLLVITFVLILINARYFIKLNQCVHNFGKATALFEQSK